MSIDEAHHFRNPGVKGEGEKEPSRYRKLQNLLKTSSRPKTLFLLTATPVNNSVQDFRHMIELFTGGDSSYFTSMGIHSLPRYFNDLEKRILGKLPAAQSGALEFGPEIIAVEQTLHSDFIFESLVVQRSRSYVK